MCNVTKIQKSGNWGLQFDNMYDILVSTKGDKGDIKMYELFYKNFNTTVNSYEEAEEILTSIFGNWDADEVFLENN